MRPPRLHIDHLLISNLQHHGRPGYASFPATMIHSLTLSFPFQAVARAYARNTALISLGIAEGTPDCARAGSREPKYASAAAGGRATAQRRGTGMTGVGRSSMCVPLPISICVRADVFSGDVERHVQRFGLLLVLLFYPCGRGTGSLDWITL